jgi:hypothetical protein
LPRLFLIFLVCLFALCGAGTRVEARLCAWPKTASGDFLHPSLDHAWAITPQSTGSHQVALVDWRETASGRPFFANGDPVNGFDPDGRLAKKRNEEGLTQNDYQKIADLIGWNGFNDNLNPHQKEYYGGLALDILLRQMEGADMSVTWQAVLNDVPGVIADGGGLIAGDSADQARQGFMLKINGPTAVVVVAGVTVISGYTRHGINQAISREAVGVSPKAILDAVKYPQQTVPQANGAIKYVGRDATVVVNSSGKVITTHANSSAGVRAGGGTRNP